MQKFTLEDEFKFTLAPDGELHLVVPKRKLREQDLAIINNGIEFSKILSAGAAAPPADAGAPKPSAAAGASKPPEKRISSLESLAEVSSRMMSAAAGQDEQIKRGKFRKLADNRDVYEISCLGTILRVWNLRARTIDLPVCFCFAYKGVKINPADLTKFAAWRSAEGTTRLNTHYVLATLAWQTRPAYAGKVIEEYNKHVADASKHILPLAVFDHSSHIVVVPDDGVEKRDKLSATRAIDEDKAAGAAEYWSWERVVKKS